jgi:hypothetical protein
MCTSSRNTCVTYIPPAYPPRPRMPSACTAVMRRRFSISLIFAVNCASRACRCESWRVLEAEVGTVDNREVLWVCVWPGVRGLSDIFAFYERIRWFRMRRFTVIEIKPCKRSTIVSVDIERKSVVYLRSCFRKRKVFRLSTLEESLRRARHLPPFCNQQSIMSNPSTAKIRRIVLTGSIAAITATGAWYGAGLKVQQERNEVRGTPFKSSIQY